MPLPTIVRAIYSPCHHVVSKKHGLKGRYRCPKCSRTFRVSHRGPGRPRIQPPPNLKYLVKDGLLLRAIAKKLRISHETVRILVKGLR